MGVNKVKTEFFLPMKPPTCTHQEKQVNWDTKTFYEPDNVKAARLKLQAHLARHVPEQKYSGPVRLVTKWCFPITGKHYDGEYKTTRPDTDNLQKMLKDIMTTLGYWTDDAQVASEIIEKFWAKIPGIYISIENL
jgi:Holliday junction resolvase RusA-like endonuclease